jgi:endonuclease/exonuclease/phosphatase family metal-dependent hydrolase
MMSSPGPAATRPAGAIGRLAALVLLAIAAGCGDGDEGPEIPVTVMTRNLYLGVDLTDVVTAPDPEEILKRAAVLWEGVMASDIPARARRLAAEIAEHKPDLVGLQEVEVFRTQIPSDFVFGPQAPPNQLNATTVVFDLLALVRQELEARGAPYRIAVEATYTDAELPARLASGQVIDLRMTDRDVILAREGVEIANPRFTPFETFIPLPLGGPMGGVLVPLRRGLGLVDAVVRGARFTFGNTHLEVGFSQASAFQESQASDLLKMLARVGGHLVLAGDFNSSPDGRGTRSYALITEKLKDVWPATNPQDGGFTCCTSLRSETRTDRTRIDIIFVRGSVTPRAARVVGTDPAGKTEGGLWPSDHAGVLATVGVRAPAGTPAP